LDHVAYDQGRNDRYPDANFTYKHFQRVASIPVEDTPGPQVESSEVLASVQRQYGPHVKIMRTTRYWVVYTE
jgi:hypothetical protein